MNPESTSKKESLLVWRRLMETAAVPELIFPFVFLAVCIVLILATRHRDELKRLPVHWSIKLLLLALLSFVLGVGPTSVVMLRVMDSASVLAQYSCIGLLSFVVGLFPALIV